MIQVGASIRQNSVLTREWKEFVDKQIKEAARAANIARKLMPVQKIDSSKIEYVYYKMTDMGDAVISTLPSPNTGDITDITRYSVPILTISKGFKLPRLYSRDVVTMNARNAAIQVTEEENKLVIDGWAPDGSNYEVKGLYQAANNSVSGSDFGTAGNAASTIGDAIAALAADNIRGPYTLLLHPTQYAELVKSFSSSGDEFAKVKGMLEGGNIISTTYITAGTGLLFARNENYMRLIVAEDIHEVSDTDLTEDRFLVYERLVPVIWETNAICKITGI